ncbi:MAG: hypothetical protein M9958_08710 [Chitinophagales bacterium]|nr:hypothetical protein [Chitinophagales bacterium]
MKILKSISILMLIFIAMSCKKDDIKIEKPNELDGLKLVQSIQNDPFIIDLYTTSGKLEQGYNEIFFTVKDVEGNLIENVESTWSPLMHMMDKNHACPYSPISLVPNSKTLHKGYIVFQMAGNETEYWDLSFNLIVQESPYTVSGKINVLPTLKKRVTTFTGSDGKKYVLAMVQPNLPKEGLNEMTALLYKMENMMMFSPVSNYTINIDPRMPSMGNHSSPNNVNLTQKSSLFYEGKVAFSMTGYWKINLQVLNESSEVLKGEAVTDENESSSIYFEVEF